MESSIILVLFLVVLIGILDVGQAMFFHRVLTERVCAGARYAAVHTYDPTAIQNVVSYNSATAPQGGGAGLFGIDPSIVQVNRYDPGASNDRTEVSISTFTLHFVSPWLMRDFTPQSFSAGMPVESAGNAQQQWGGPRGVGLVGCGQVQLRWQAWMPTRPAARGSRSASSRLRFSPASDRPAPERG